MGNATSRVAFFESEQTIPALQSRGKPVRSEAFNDAGHGFVRPDDGRRVYAAVAAHLARIMPVSRPSPGA